ncbi:MAG: hypothetical protein HY328_18535 [Chloroflexi bacterium]|nr:hypothetical protein [Chloroflexota bacterium]
MLNFPPNERSAQAAQTQRWREMTDQLFVYYLGSEAGRYIITGAGTDGEWRYLVGERVDERLLESLCPPSHPGKV